MTLTKLEKTTFVFLTVFFFLGAFVLFIQRSVIIKKNALVEMAIRDIQSRTPHDEALKKGKPVRSDDENQKLNVNTATIDQLDALQGVGKTLAERIVEHREKNGPFKDFSDFSAVKGITPKKISELGKLICFTGGSTSTQKKLNLNFASETEIEALPGVGPTLARSIVDFRSQKGTFHSLDDLQDVPGLTEKTYRKFEKLVEVK